MKKFLPFVFPLVALLIVLFLAVRWYNTQTNQNKEQIADFGDITIQNLASPSPGTNNQMAKDLKSVDLKGETEQGVVRYEVKDGQLQLMVSADLPQLRTGTYQVWFKKVDSDVKRKIMTLTNGKGGYAGSVGVESSVLPVEIVVTKEMQNDEVMEIVLMNGVIPAEDTR